MNRPTTGVLILLLSLAFQYFIFLHFPVPPKKCMFSPDNWSRDASNSSALWLLKGSPPPSYWMETSRFLLFFFSFFAFFQRHSQKTFLLHPRPLCWETFFTSTPTTLLTTPSEKLNPWAHSRWMCCKNNTPCWSVAALF